MQDMALGDQFLEFMLQWCTLRGNAVALRIIAADKIV
jgi:phage portal protein BeeE